MAVDRGQHDFLWESSLLCLFLWAQCAKGVTTQITTNCRCANCISKFLEWCISQQVFTPYPYNLRFRWGLTAFTIIWAKHLGFIVVFTIILEYKNWGVNTCNSMQHRFDDFCTSDIMWCVDYSIDLSLYNCDVVQLPNNSDGEASPPQSADR